MKLRITKTMLWFLSGIGLTIIFFRIINGLGSVVALTDMLPWGLWKGGGVVALVPIGGAGFTLAALVYVFHWKRFKPLARGAVLLGLMCYGSVAFGLTIDIGISWRIVFPTVFWQFHSTLFEIAWCIMLYLMVLVFEFSHTVLERFNFPRLSYILEKLTLVFVIAGISLSTLHQSSLGTLFLATPYRLHPLWYTDLLPVMFFITSIGLGCLTISWVTIAVHWLYDAEQPQKTVAGLGQIAFYVFGLYTLLKFGEIIYAGESSLLFGANWDCYNFWIEMLLGALIPFFLLSTKRFRENTSAMFWISSAAIIGISLNRVNVAGLATLSLTESTYFPYLTEWLITFSILSAAGLIYLFAVENFKVFEAITPDVVERTYRLERIDHANWKTLFFTSPIAEPRLYSAIFVFAIGIALGFLPYKVIYGITPEKTPTSGARIVEIFQMKDPTDPGTQFLVPGDVDPVPPESQKVDMFMIDGNRDGSYVLFNHDQHVAKKGNKESCVLCHHMNKPFEKASRCYECHSDMYLPVYIFKHEAHVKKTGGNKHCVKCHVDLALPKVRKNTTPCEKCHLNMRPQGSLVKVEAAEKKLMASGYMDAMHNLCITCHEQEQKKLAEKNENFSRCTNCHRDVPSIEAKPWAKKL
ncbi:cytochrome c3 family protein [candidate division CSSED10-310 bacterium]|uniref:Cytochrome c3 family protein n=1 Tax=candidate division CSSED10-310 bacterium TaxID=2855610 RepID=A0ABV6Z104_UNCC1